jgi:hypothetical protein
MTRTVEREISEEWCSSAWEREWEVEAEGKAGEEDAALEDTESRPPSTTGCTAGWLTVISMAAPKYVSCYGGGEREKGRQSGRTTCGEPFLDFWGGQSPS